MSPFSVRDTVNRGLVVALAAVALLGGASAASGQMELAVITGTCTDEAGTPLAGVSLRLKDVERGSEIVFQSDKDGHFYRRGLKAIEYEFLVDKEGYQPIKNRLKLTAGMDKRFNFKLVKAAPPGAEEFAKGVAAFNAGDAAGAIAAFEAAVKKAPEAPEVHVNLALAYIRVKRSSDAIVELEKASALAPNQPRFLFQLGGAYVDAKQYPKAITAFESGLKLQPSLTDPLAFEATLTLGAVYFAAGQMDQAVERFGAALAAKPDSAAAKLGLGKCFASKGETDKALEYFQQVMTSAPGTPEAAEADAFIKALKKF
ncbi:MAG: tetratricopeptide repeat protein [Acidobacteriota bacterium]